MSDGELRKIFRKHLTGFDVLAVETGGSAAGVPDMNLCKNGTELWIENKACDHWRVTIRPMQVGWIERRLLHGGRVFIAVRRGDTELWLYNGDRVRELKTTRIDAVPSRGVWYGGAAKWDWPAIEQILLA